jgi:hypothetical protein
MNSVSRGLRFIPVADLIDPHVEILNIDSANKDPESTFKII